MTFSQITTGKLIMQINRPKCVYEVSPVNRIMALRTTQVKHSWLLNKTIKGTSDKGTLFKRGQCNFGNKPECNLEIKMSCLQGSLRYYQKSVTPPLAVPAEE